MVLSIKEYNQQDYAINSYKTSLVPSEKLAQSFGGFNQQAYLPESTKLVLKAGIGFRNHPQTDAVASLLSNPQSIQKIDNVRIILSKFVRLEKDWDTYGAVPISSESIRIAHRLVMAIIRLCLDTDEVKVPDVIAPIPNGGVHLEWIGSHKEIEVDIGPNGELGYLLIEGEGKDRQFSEKDEDSWTHIIDLIKMVILTLGK